MLRHDSPSSDGPGGVVSAFGVCTAVRFAVVDAGRACETSGTSGALSASSVRMALTRSRRAGMGIVAGGWRRGCRADAETSPSRLHRQFREFAAVPGVTGCGNGTAGHVPWVPCRRCDRLAAAVRGKCRVESWRVVAWVCVAKAMGHVRGGRAGYRGLARTRTSATCAEPMMRTRGASGFAAIGNTRDSSVASAIIV